MGSLNPTTYTESFKENAVRKLVGPGSPGLNATARKIGLPASTLYGWKKKYAMHSSMKNNNKGSKVWTPEQKLEVVMKAFSMSENELGEYLRSNGLYSSDLDAFREECLSGLKSKGRPKLDPEVVGLRKEKKTLERDLKRTEKALAEQSARIILLKKSHEIWGDPEDEE